MNPSTQHWGTDAENSVELVEPVDYASAFHKEALRGGLISEGITDAIDSQNNRPGAPRSAGAFMGLVCTIGRGRTDKGALSAAQARPPGCHRGGHDVVRKRRGLHFFPPLRPLQTRQRTCSGPRGSPPLPIGVM
jgi:hypothetical protein